MTSRLEELAGVVEKLTGPCRETDTQIKLAFAAQLFAGGATKDDAVRILGGDLYADAPPYTGSLDAAMTLVPEGWFGSMPINRNCDAWLRASNDSQIIYGKGATSALALTAASLRARAASEPDHGG